MARAYKKLGQRDKAIPLTVQQIAIQMDSNRNLVLSVIRVLRQRAPNVLSVVFFGVFDSQVLCLQRPEQTPEQKAVGSNPTGRATKKPVFMRVS